MGVDRRITTTYECDRCKRIATDPYRFNNSYAVIKRDMAGRSGLSGDVGGATLHYWLCGHCDNDFADWLKEGKNE